MDVKKFQDARSKELESFEKTMGNLKTEYNTTLRSAIQETDREKQNDNIQEVLSLNASMVSEIHSILSILRQHGDSEFNQKTLDNLTQDLIKYQKEYDDIQKGKDREQTLKMILASTKKKYEETSWMFTFYLAALILLSFIILILIIKNSFSIPFINNGS